MLGIQPFVFKRVKTVIPIVSGFRFSDTQVNDAVSGTIDWTSLANVEADDAAITSLTLSSETSTTKVLRISNFGFTVPTDATITGVAIKFERSDAGKVGSGADSIIQLVVADALVGNNLSTATAYTGSPTILNVGGIDNLWGLSSLTPAQVNATTFGVAVQATGTFKQLLIDYITMQVYYLA